MTRRVTVRGPRGQRRRHRRRGRRRWCSCTGSAARGRTGCSTSRPFMDSHRVIALDLPGLRRVADAARGDLDPGLRADRSTRCCDAARASSPPVVVGNSMGGFVAAELALSFSTRVRAARARLAPPGSRSSTSGAQPLLVGARVWAGGRDVAAARAGTRWSRARGRGGSALQMIVRYPERLSPALTYELARGAGTPGFVPGAGGAALLRASATSSRGSRCRCWSSGAATTCSSRAATRASTCELIGDNARREMFEDTGPPADGRAPVALQRAARRRSWPASASPRRASRASAPKVGATGSSGNTRRARAAHVAQAHVRLRAAEREQPRQALGDRVVDRLRSPARSRAVQRISSSGATIDCS